MKRKKFLKLSAAGLGSLYTLPSCSVRINPYRFFTLAEAKCIIALSDQIIPPDKEWPGAAFAGIVNYIDRQLTEVFTEEQIKYRDGIKGLQKTSLRMYSKLFEELESEIQIELLKEVEKNELPEDLWLNQQPANFFNMVIKHTMQGFYGSPRHGGNKNYISYRMMNLEYPYIVGQNRYRVKYGQ